MSLSVAAALLMLSPACGPAGYIELVVDSAEDPDTQQPLLLITDIDALNVRIDDPRDGTTLLQRLYSLEDLNHEFPVVIVFEPHDDVARQLDATLSGQRGQNRVAEGAWRFTWRTGYVNTVPIPLEPVTP